MDIDGGVVIARDFTAIPPAGLDALRLAHQAQRPPATRQTVPRCKRLRRRQHPQGTAQAGPAVRAAHAESARCPGAARRAAAAGGGPVTAQALSGRCSSRSLRPYTASGPKRARSRSMRSPLCPPASPPCSPGCQSAAASGQLRHQDFGAQLAGAHRLRQPQRPQALAEKGREALPIRRRRRERQAHSASAAHADGQVSIRAPPRRTGVPRGKTPSSANSGARAARSRA